MPLLLFLLLLLLLLMAPNAVPRQAVVWLQLPPRTTQQAPTLAYQLLARHGCPLAATGVAHPALPISGTC